MDNKHIKNKSDISPTKPPLLPKPKFLLTSPNNYGIKAKSRICVVTSPISPETPSEVKLFSKAEEKQESLIKNSESFEQCVQSLPRNVDVELTHGSSFESLSNSSITDLPARPNTSFLHNEVDDSITIEEFKCGEEQVNLSTPVSDHYSLKEEELNKNEQHLLHSKISNWASSFGKEEKVCDYLDADVSDSEVGDSISQRSIDLSLDSTLNNTCVEVSAETTIQKQNAKKKEAFLIAQEFMTSEQQYLEAIHLIVYHFTEHLQSYSAANNLGPVIPKNDLDKLITTLPQLQSLNENLLSDIENRIKNWHELPKIADVIVKKGPFLKLYSTYIKNFELNWAFLDECCSKYPKFAKALREFESTDRCRKLTLKHYMLKPVQRIPQYRLLLEKYLKQLDGESCEYYDTKNALTIVQDVLDHANSSIKLGDNMSKLLKIQSSLGDYEIIKPGREFIKEGELYKLSRKEMQLRYFVLLSDCLLYTTYSTSISSLKVKHELQLSGMKVYMHQTESLEFDIITSTRSFTLRARSEEECADWLNALHSAIKEKNQRQLTFLSMKCMDKSINSNTLKLGKEAPIWIQDKRTTMCQACTAEFTVTFRRHHCRSCGKVVCGTCSNNRAPLQYLKFQSARVCDECYDFLLKEFDDPINNMFEVVKEELQLSDDETASSLENLKTSFKKFDSAKKTRKFVPQRLKEVTANDTGSSISGWLFKKGKRGWKRLWFVLKEQVLYIYKASHDVVAYESIPVLGYTVNISTEDCGEEIDSNLSFSLNHPGQVSLVFSALNKQSADKWIEALREATILK